MVTGAVVHVCFSGEDRSWLLSTSVHLGVVAPLVRFNVPCKAPKRQRNCPMFWSVRSKETGRSGLKFISTKDPGHVIDLTTPYK